MSSRTAVGRPVDELERILVPEEVGPYERARGAQRGFRLQVGEHGRQR
jgi:hypothetical protein